MGDARSEVIDLTEYRLRNETGFHCNVEDAYLVKKDGLIIRVGAEFTSLFGYGEEDLIGKPIWEFIENSDGSKRRSIDHSNMEFPKISVVLHKNGEKVPSILCSYLKVVAGTRYGCVRFKRLNLKNEMSGRRNSMR